MDIDSQLFPLFSSFIRDLGKTYPEIKNCLYRNYGECITDIDNKSLSDFPKLQTFINIVSESKGKITKKDPSFFEIDNILEDISFQKLWSKNISDKTRSTIWKYFQTFEIIAINLKSSQDLQDAMSSLQNDQEIDLSDPSNKEVARDLKKLKQLSESVQQPDPSQESDLDEMLGGMLDSNIGQIAKEVAGSIDMEQLFGNIDESSNPMDIMSKMMDPSKMGTIFQNIDTVMKQKMECGDIKRDDLTKEAEDMCGTMSQNPMFANMMNQMNPTNSATPATPATPTNPTTPDMTFEDVEDDEDTDTREETRKRLKEKLKLKQQERTGS